MDLPTVKYFCLTKSFFTFSQQFSSLNLSDSNFLLKWFFDALWTNTQQNCFSKITMDMQVWFSDDNFSSDSGSVAFNINNYQSHQKPFIGIFLRLRLTQNEVTYRHSSTQTYSLTEDRKSKCFSYHKWHKINTVTISTVELRPV